MLLFSQLVERVRQRLPAGLDAEDLDAFIEKHRDTILFEQLAAHRRFPHLLTLNLGMGRDSLAMLCLLRERALEVDGAAIGPEAVDAVIFSDTGAEWPFTYALVPHARRFCERMGVRFLHLQKPPADGPRGWRTNPRAKGDRTPPAWQLGTAAWSIEEKAREGAYHRRPPIREEYMRFGTIAVTSNSSCTDNHKVQVIRRAVSDLSVQTFGLDNPAWGRLVKKGTRRPHTVLIGIAADEPDRIEYPERPYYERPVYPLFDMGITKDDEAAILRRHGWDVPELPVYKSGCWLCPYQPVGWYYFLLQDYPHLFALVEEYEARALARNPNLHIIAGKKGRPIRETVHRWRQRHPHATRAAVFDKSYSRCEKPDHAAEMGVAA